MGDEGAMGDIWGTGAQVALECEGDRQKMRYMCRGFCGIGNKTARLGFVSGFVTRLCCFE